MAALNSVKTSRMSSAVAAGFPSVHHHESQATSTGFSAFPLQSWSPSICKASIRNVSSVSSTRRGSAAVGRRRLVRRHAKFQQFTAGENSEGQKGGFDELPGLVEVRNESSESSSDDEKEREDRVLPENLEGAVIHSSESTALYINSGGTRAICKLGAPFYILTVTGARSMRLAELCRREHCHTASYSAARYTIGLNQPCAGELPAQVELLLPEFQNLGEEGDQLRIWNLSRVFLDDLQARLGTQQMKAIFPDAGVAAMLKYHWKDAQFSFASLNDKKPINAEDDVVVLVAPDYQGLADVERIAVALVDGDDGPPRPLVMWNPRLQSGEVGIGLNVRRMREFFLSTFNTVYSIRSLSFGSIFRRFPGNWQVFFDDEQVPGRYILAKVEKVRPVLEDVEMLYMAKQGRARGEQSDELPPLQNVLGVFASLNRFMRSLSR